MTISFSKPLKAVRRDWVMPIDVSPPAGLSDEILKSIMAQRRAEWAPMEEFAKYVLAIGYTPADCLIQTVRGTDSMDEPSVEIHRLLVRGEPCFEVTVTRSPMRDCKFTYTVEPKIIKLPDCVAAH